MIRDKVKMWKNTFFFLITPFGLAANEVTEGTSRIGPISNSSSGDQEHQQLRGGRLSGDIKHTFKQRELTTGDVFDLPFTVSPFQATVHDNKTGAEILYKDCDLSPFNAQNTLDASCKAIHECHLASNREGGYQGYFFTINPEQDFSFDFFLQEEFLMIDITARVAVNHGRYHNIRFDVYNDNDGRTEAISRTVRFMGTGYQKFKDVTWSKVRLDKNESTQKLYVTFEDDNVNLCSVAVKATPVSAREPGEKLRLPFTVSPFQATVHDDKTGDSVFGDCDRFPFDAQHTSDPICQLVDWCNLGWTEAGEYLGYFFEVDPAIDLTSRGDHEEVLLVDITVRVSAYFGSNREIQLAVYNEADGKENGVIQSFAVAGTGYQNYEDITWKDVLLNKDETEHMLYVVFPEGRLNLCSISVAAPISPRIIIPDAEFTLPFTASAFQATVHDDKTDSVLGNCHRPPFDAQYTFDKVCQTVDECNMGWTKAGEYAGYSFRVSEKDYSFDTFNREELLLVDVTVRVAAANNRNIRLEVLNKIDEPNGGISQTFTLIGTGYQDFQDISWNGLSLNKNATEHILYVVFLDGNTNFCSASVKPTRAIPFRAPALEFTDFLDVSDAPYGNCGDGLVNAQTTRDSICIHRDGSNCNVGYREPGEWLSYDFHSFDSDDYHVYARVATAVPGMTIRIEIMGGDYDMSSQATVFAFDIPSLGWQEFTDVGFPIFLNDGRYSVKIHFETGLVNLCSVQVVYAAQWGAGEYNVPISYNALEYFEAIDDNPNNIGNCDAEGPPDSQITRDAGCQALGECHIAFTEPGEILRYDFATDFNSSKPDSHHPKVDLILRVASASSSKRFLVEVDGNRRIFTTPGKGYHTFEDIVWETVELANVYYHAMYISFLDGFTNLCMVSMNPSAE